MEEILKMKNIDYYYQTKRNKVEILQDVNFTFEQGKLYTIVGPSGSGKTTALTLLGGLEVPKNGEVLYKDKDLKEMGYDNFRNQKMGIVFQAYNLLNYMTPLQNVLAAMDITKNEIPNKKERAVELLEKMGIDQHMMHRNVSQLSGGEQQRVAIARALSTQSEILLADEPTGNLDSDTAKEIIEIFKMLAHEEHKCVIAVTHSEDFAKSADIIIRLKNKKFICDNRWL
jgi:putative ABC transport system ATP-binding protein